MGELNAKTHFLLKVFGIFAKHYSNNQIYNKR